jgi:hypothetical protein
LDGFGGRSARAFGLSGRRRSQAALLMGASERLALAVGVAVRRFNRRDCLFGGVICVRLRLRAPARLCAVFELGGVLSRRFMPITRERLLFWSASLSVCVAGWLIAHALAYRLVASGDEGSHALVQGTGHGHLAFSPYLIAGSAAVLVLALGGAVVAGATGRTRPAVPLAPFVLLPLLDFVCHMVLESLQHGGEVSPGAALEPVFLVGLVFQVPLALATLLLARAAMRWAEGLGRGLTPRWRPRPPGLALPAPPRLLIGTEHRPSIPALAWGYTERGPPTSPLVR